MFGRNAVSSPISGRNEQQTVHEVDARVVGQPAEHRGADAGHAEREAEEQARIMPTRPGTSSCA